MASEIRVNQIQSRTGVSTISFTETGPIISGITTIIGDLDVTGLVSYDDVTNIDSVGVVTARDGIRVTGDSIHVESSEDRLLYLKSTDANAYLTFEDTDSSSGFANRVGTVSDGLYFSTGGGGERLRITSAGKIGIGHQQEGQITKELTIRPANDGGIRFVRPGAAGASVMSHLELTTTTSGSTFPSGEAYTVKYNTINNDQIFTTYAGGGTGGNISFQTGSGSGNEVERLRITADGNVGIGSAIPGGVLDLYHATQNTILNVKSGDAGSVINIIDPSQRSSIEQSGTTLKIISDTGAEFANSDIRLQVDGSTKMLVDSYGCIRVGNTHSQTTSGNTKRIALGAKASIWGWTSGNINGALTLADNYYWDGTNNRAIEADEAAYLTLRSGTLRYGTTDSTPSAGGVTGLTEKFRVDTSGNLLLGQGHTTASDLAGGFTKRLAIEGTSAANSSIGLVRNANDDNPPYIYFGKSRGTSAGSNTVIGNGDTIGMVNFAGSRGSGSFGDAVNLRAIADANFTGSSSPGRFSVWTTPVNSTSPLESFQVNSAGAITAPRNVSWSYSRINSNASWGSASGLTYGGRQYRSPLPLFGTSATDYDTHNALTTFTSGSGTGIKFTAPVGGKYLVMLNMSSVKNHTNADWGSIGLMVNTTAQASTGSLEYMLDTMYYPDSTSTGNQLGWGGSVIIHVSENDYIVPYTMSVEHFSSDNRFYFQGYLLG